METLKQQQQQQQQQAEKKSASESTKKSGILAKINARLRHFDALTTLLREALRTLNLLLPLEGNFSVFYVCFYGFFLLDLRVVFLLSPFSNSFLGWLVPLLLLSWLLFGLVCMYLCCARLFHRFYAHYESINHASRFANPS